MYRLFQIFLFLLSAGRLCAQESSPELSSYTGQAEITGLHSVTLKPGFHIPQGSNVRIYLSATANAGGQPTVSKNYVLVRRFLQSGVSEANLDAVRPADAESWNVTYLDGLGRPVQQIAVMGSPSLRDIVHYQVYDSAGRQVVQHEPYVEQGGVSGSFRSGAAASQLAYYATSNTWDPHIGKTAFPRSVTVLESTPLSRVIEQGAPGQAWQPGSARNEITGRTVVTEYGSNVAAGVESVKIWRASASGASVSSNYAAGTLVRITRKDENWVSGRAGTVDEFTDKSGKVILQRLWKSSTEALDTYYIYDLFGQLRYVLPPAVTVSSFTESDALFENFIYAYRYDGRKRAVEKKVPGKGWEYFIYNRANQLALSQDAAQRARNEWNYIRYDNLGRTIGTGLYVNTSQTTLAQVRTLVENFTGSWHEQRGGAANYPGTSFPAAGSGITLTPLTVNYYDDYSFSGAPGLSAQGITPSTLTSGIPTGALTYLDNGTQPLLTVSYYDDKGQMVQVASQNHLGGTDYVTSSFGFAGELLSSNQQHKASATGPVTTVLTSYSYDHAGRLLDTRKKVNAQAEILQSRNVYNEIGQLKQKRLHSENGGTNFISTIDHSYNERGWLTRIGSADFTEVLNYNLPSLTTTAKQYNGNISEQQWGHGTTATPNRFVYAYDALRRLTSGTSSGTVMSEVLTYDNMGNIATLRRDNGTTVNYGYTGNRLTALTGGISGTFTYDTNGSATKDRTGMSFTYNHLSLPKTATRTGTSASYLYDSNGVRLRRTVITSSGTIQRDYVGGIEYSKVGSAASAIELIHTEEGYLQNNGGTYAYYYNLRDHLGNVRATLQRISATAGTVIQKDDYYPFGKRKGIVTSGLNNYLYNGKERLGELSAGSHSFGSSYNLDAQYDYGARFYDAEVGRWNVVDPLASNYASWSPYAYVGNSPARFVDPNGMYRFDALGNMILSSTHEIAQFFKYVGKQGYSESTFQAFVKDPANGFAIDLPMVYIDGSRSSIRNMESVQQRAADLYSYTHGNVYVGSGYSNLPTTSTGRRVREGIHSGLDLLGMAPGWGEAADFTNGVFYAFEGDFFNAGISMSATMPIAGLAPTATRLANKVAKRVRNSHLAGMLHPKSGVPFDALGFPDFTKNLYQGGKNDVIITPTGDRIKDFAAANKAAGYSKTPSGFTWHHHQSTGRMQLVEFEAHVQTGHTGGFALWDLEK